MHSCLAGLRNCIPSDAHSGVQDCRQPPLTMQEPNWGQESTNKRGGSGGEATGLESDWQTLFGAASQNQWQTQAIAAESPF